jgi:hypothetical protein
MASIEKRVRNDKVSYRAIGTRAAGSASRPSVARSTPRSTWP